MVRDQCLERLGEGEHQMTSVVKRTRRTALTWDQEYKKPNVDDLRDQLQKITKRSVSNKQMFMLCLGIGFDQNCIRGVPPRTSDAVRWDGVTEADYALFNSVALAHSKDYKILLDEDAIYDIVEQYAAGGLMIISKELNSQPDFSNWLRTMLFKKAELNLRN